MFGGEGISSGEGGIRTHAPFRTNGFQDRLVMTTSIPLHVRAPLSSAKIILAKKECCVNNFSQLFSKDFPSSSLGRYLSALSIKASAIFKSSGVVIFIFS